MPRIHHAMLGILIIFGLAFGASLPTDVDNCQRGCDPKNAADYSEKQYLWLSSDEWKKCDWESVQQFPDRYSCDPIPCHSVSVCKAGCWPESYAPAYTKVTSAEADGYIAYHRQAVAEYSSLPAQSCGNMTNKWSGAALQEGAIGHLLFYGKKSYQEAAAAYVQAGAYMEDAYDNGFTKVPYSGATSNPMSLAGMYYRYAATSYCNASMPAEAKTQSENARRVYRIAGFTEDHINGLVDDGCPGATTGGTATPPPATEITKLSGRILYRDYKEAVAYTRMGFNEKEERGMPYMNYTFVYGSTEINGSTDADGKYSISFSPPLKPVAGTQAELLARFADKDGRMIVTKGNSKGKDGLYTGLGDFSAFVNFDLSAKSGSTEAAFDFDINGSTTSEYAKIYYNTYFAVNYAEEVLGEQMEKGKPLMVYVTPEGDTAYHVSGYGIAIGDDCAVFGYPDAPLNREWHETGHRVQYDGFGSMPRMQGDTNHGSYANPTSTDSLKEGWAESFAAMVSRFRGSQYPNLYPSGYSMVNLEVNYKIVGRGGPKTPDEEIVAASLIWDFLDGKNAADRDGLEMTHEDFWTLYKANYTYSNGTSGPVGSLADMYEAFNSTAGHGFHDDYDNDGMDNLDELFVVHGIFVDDDNDTNYTAGERMGVTLAQAGQGNQSAIRRKLQPAQGTNLGITIKSDSGKDVDSVVRVDVRFQKPYDIYDYAYYVRVPAGTDRINLEMPENDYNATATVSAALPGYSESAANYSISNGDYWGKVNAATDTFDSHNFVLDYEGGAFCSSGSDCEAGEECDSGSCKVPPEGACGAAFALPALVFCCLFIRLRAARCC